MKTLALAIFGVLLVLTGAASATEPPVNFAIHETPQLVPEISFQDSNGQPKTLADFSGKVVLLNIWATWCAPCRKEMPTLDRLQAELGGPDFEVVALSVDRKGPEAVRKFFDEIGIKHLALNIETSGKAMFTLGAFGLPLTLLIDREEREVGRVIGPAEWDSPEMVAFIRDRIAAK
jgi:thiol-disulfide isomerase/thioredoxin